jgi:hypothetical protein
MSTYSISTYRTDLPEAHLNGIMSTGLCLGGNQ